MSEIKDHPFFQSINWDLAMRRGLKPPVYPSKAKLSKKNVKKEVFENTEAFRPISDWTFIENTNF